MSRALPPNPHLDVLRKQARQLFRAYRDGDAEAFGRIRAYIPELRQASDAAIVQQKLSLQSAQCVLAREYGFYNWAELSKAVGIMRQAGPAMLQEADDCLGRGQPIHVLVPEHVADEVWGWLAGHCGSERVLRIFRDSRTPYDTLTAALTKAAVVVGCPHAVAFAVIYERLGQPYAGNLGVIELVAIARAFVNVPFSDERSPLVISAPEGDTDVMRDLASMYLTAFYPLYGSMADHRY
ncbi:MAG: hypothetical protein WDA75_16525 [Candidatus Latescibacterota bacterium]|jgi:hypothetical protein